MYLQKYHRQNPSTSLKSTRQRDFDTKPIGNPVGYRFIPHLFIAGIKIPAHRNVNPTLSLKPQGSFCNE